MKNGLLFLLTFLYSVALFAQSRPTTGLRGTVKSAKGEALPYAAVVVRGTSNGTITNAEGRYEIGLAPGRYEIVFQFLGFQSVQRSVEVGAEFVTLDVTLAEQAIRLAEVQTKGGQEDPAYSIMRRAIAKSRFHQLQVDRFKARVYTKSSFTVLDLPNTAEWMFKKQLKEAEKEANFKVGRPILNEQIAEVSFQQPNTYRQRIVANRNSTGDFATPSQYYNVSFYSPTVANVVSPLSPKAFAYYRFEYEGTYSEQGVEINKIRVIPRQYGEGVFRGVIYIIENTWAIHSLQLETVSAQGFTVNTRFLYSPVKSVWVPVNQRFDVNGTFFGVKFTGQFVRTQTFNEFVVNPAFVEDVRVVDEKKDQPAVTLSNRDIKGRQFDEMVKKQKEFSTKNLKQLIKEYEKQEKEERKKKKEDVAVMRDDSLVIDSLATKRSGTFWDSLRSVPLTSAESISYKKSDSLKIVREIGKIKTDSTGRRDTTKRRSPNKFSPEQLLGGYTWNLNKKTALVYTSPLMQVEYNTVEGYAVEGGLQLRYRPRLDSTLRRLGSIPQRQWTIGGTGRYQFGPNKLVGYGTAQYQHRFSRIGLTGGRYVSQFNPDNPISPALNTLTTTFFEQNFLKIYQKDYVNLTASVSPFDQRITLSGSLEYAERTELFNFREDPRPFLRVDVRGRSYTPNRPTNIELPNTGFPVHQAVVLNLTASGRLGATQYYIRNGRRFARRNNDSPLLTLNYRKGLSGLAGSDVDYDFVRATLSHSVETGIRSRLSYQLSAGAFLNDRSLYFPDFNHFAGNEFFFQQGDVVSTFRMLPYYQFSTGRRYLEGHVLAEFRKFLITQITLVRLTGLKENLFVHYLRTPALKNYTEIGYGLDGLIPQVLPVFRVEVISQFQDLKYQRLGFRIGTTLKFGR